MPRPRKNPTAQPRGRPRSRPQEPKLGAAPEENAGDWLIQAAVPDPYDEERFDDEEAIRDEVEAIHDTFDRAQAGAVGVPYHVWTTLSERQKKQAADESYARQREAIEEAAEYTGTGTSTTEFPLLNLTERNQDLKALRRPEQFQAYAHSLLRKEHFDATGKPMYIVMCDPPVRFTVEGEERFYHPEVSYIQVRAVGQKRRQGFTTRPRHPFLPKPDIRCDMDNAAVYGLAGRQCDYLGRTSREVEDHMMSVHPREYQTHLREIERTREEQRLASDQSRAAREQRREELMIAALEKIAGTQPAA